MNDLEPRRNGHCYGRDPANHATCPVTWGYYGRLVWRCDCPCHATPEDRGELW